MLITFADVRQKAACTAVLSLMFALCTPLEVHAAGNARFELRPHCSSGEEELKNVFGGPFPDTDYFAKIMDGSCPSYEVRDPQSQQTALLGTGDSVEMDLVLYNPDKRPINRFRAWIAYDSSALEGLEIEISPKFPIPTPGENAVAASEGYIKLSGTTQSPVTDEKILIARIRMSVTNPRFAGTPLTFFEASGNADSKTGVFTQEGSQESNILAVNPGYLFVRFNRASTQATSSVASGIVETASAAENSSSAASQQSSSVTPAVLASTVFTMLQVQGLRVTTEGSSIFLAWDALPSSDLVGYNVYYGTTSGKYIQRRGVEKNAASLTIRALPIGVTYYFAIRGVNAQNQETEFSQEVGISVGNPSTSTSPLIGGTRPNPTPGTNGSVAGETGVSSTLLILLVVSAITGTFVAFRRQWGAAPAHI